MMKTVFNIGALLLVLFSYVCVRACSCGGRPTVCESYAAANAVFVGYVRSVENRKEKDEEGHEFLGGQKAFVQVEKVFKGTVKADVIFRSFGTSCDPEYKEGARWLFYGYHNKEDNTWRINGCDRSGSVERASEDLLYLQGLPKTGATTRISGTLTHYEDDPEKGFSVVKHVMGAKVRIVGERKTFETYTDKNGVFEVYGLPAGLYSVTPEIPLGLKIRFPSTSGSMVRLGQELKYELKEKSCVGAGFVFSSDTALTGRVFASDGTFLPAVCLRLEPVNKRAGPYFRILDCTNEDGRYKMDEIPPGDYLIVANDEGKISSSEPFPTLYYPGTFEKDKATVVTITPGAKLQDYDIHVPSQSPTSLLSGVLLYSDGQPVPEGYVRFQATSAKEGYDGDARTPVDAEGRFALTVLQGLKGSLTGFLITYEGEYVNCPQLDKLIKEQKVVVGEVHNKPFMILTNSDLSNLTLRFPFPRCAKAKRE